MVDNSSQRPHLRFCLLEPVHHAHLSVRRRRGRGVFLRQLALSRHWVSGDGRELGAMNDPRAPVYQ